MKPLIVEQYQLDHDFIQHNHQGERRTWYVFWLTLIMMVIEISAGTLFGSMALLADGWHMGTHAAAFCITLFAYYYARKHQTSEKYSYGTGKVSVLGGFTSAIALSIVALLMMGESVHRLFSPLTIHFNEAILVAVVGLIVNIASMFLLGHGHVHEHHAHSHSHVHHHDHNLKAAYFHVLADALTSLLAIVALVIGKYMGWHWLDPVMGIVGSIIITRWAWQLLKQTGPTLLDESIDDNTKSAVVEALESIPNTQITDIHIWKVSAHHFATSICLVSDSGLSSKDFKQVLTKFDKLRHITLETNHYRE
ncbi:CDF family Co(II)/Ni(II) efflux transporter DmeF [Vibrio hangzhouensis]|uniref:Cation diffusion facilitator family transporter n=1 Tax=Vibrio hangzhouensis TaxID=462991 RepID=A0A1H5TCY2_9VIBR|nr:CDF family Co(II)/Ni(II) efflux transporter DmeF [Vibrio hangzhouensis]SEF60614.1 cation diffusion facilitator family transporter [Vibrio hangzhouensis]